MTSVPAMAQRSIKWCQSRLFLAKRDASRANTAPTSDASEFVEIDPQVLPRARTHLMSQQTKSGAWTRYDWLKKNQIDDQTMTAYVARALATSSRSLDAKERTTIGTSVGTALSYLEDRIGEWRDPYLVGITRLLLSMRSGKSTLRMLANCWHGWLTMKVLRRTGTLRQTPVLSTDGARLGGWRPRLLPFKLLHDWKH
jgi:A-macroglobulin complement component